MALIYGEIGNGGVSPLKLDPNANLYVNVGAVSDALPVAVQPGARRVWRPEELEMATVGGDGRCNLWRYITPGNSSYYSKPYAWEGCNDITLYTYLGRLATGTPTVDMFLCASMTGGADFWSNAVTITPGSNFGRVTATTGVAFGIISSAFLPDGYDATTVTNNATHRRGVPYLFWGFYMKCSAAGVPVTVFAQGR